MDHRCPHCGESLRLRRLTHAIISRLEIECPKCGRKLRRNVHRVEEAIVVASFGLLVAFALAAHALGREGLILAGLAAAASGAVALPLLERTWLKDWPRYRRPDPTPPEERP